MPRASGFWFKKLWQTGLENLHNNLLPDAGCLYQFIQRCRSYKYGEQHAWLLQRPINKIRSSICVPSPQAQAKSVLQIGWLSRRHMATIGMAPAVMAGISVFLQRPRLAVPHVGVFSVLRYGRHGLYLQVRLFLNISEPRAFDRRTPTVQFRSRVTHRRPARERPMGGARPGVIHRPWSSRLARVDRGWGSPHAHGACSERSIWSLSRRCTGAGQEKHTTIRRTVQNRDMACHEHWISKTDVLDGLENLE